MGDVDPCLAGGDGFFPGLCEPSTAPEPCEGAFDYPPSHNADYGNECDSRAHECRSACGGDAISRCLCSSAPRRLFPIRSAAASDVTVGEMGVAQRHLHIGMAEQTERTTGTGTPFMTAWLAHRMAEVVKAHVLDPGLRAGRDTRAGRPDSAGGMRPGARGRRRGCVCAAAG